MSEDDKLRRGGSMSGEDRDLASIRRARDESKRSREVAIASTDDDGSSDDDDQGVPSEAADADDTGLTERIKQDPDLALLFQKGEHNKKRIRAFAREAADRDLEIAGEKPPEARFTKMEKHLKLVHLVIVLIAIPVITSTVLVAKYIYGKGLETGVSTVVQQRLIEDLAELRKSVGDVQHQISDMHDEILRLQQHQDDLGRHRPAAVDSAHGSAASPTP